MAIHCVRKLTLYISPSAGRAITWLVANKRQGMSIEGKVKMIPKKRKIKKNES
jgi:hypothetical protein